MTSSSSQFSMSKYVNIKYKTEGNLKERFYNVSTARAALKAIV